MKKHGRIAAWAAAGMAGLCLFARTAAGATEGSWPIAIAIAPSFEAPGADQDVVGLRLNLLAARHRNVAFLDIGTLAGMVTREGSPLETRADAKASKRFKRLADLTGSRLKVPDCDIL